ncbi:MAG TPA: dsRBD fold-containing protein [Acidimicrobiia bacterium]|nr:dsRBD fold-containing protein [Acidimicrobiia bacterium]
MEKDITLSIHVVEDERETRATAVLDLRGEHFESIGQARRNPSDPQKPLIGEELAVARALRKLESELMEAAWDKIERRAILA